MANNSLFDPQKIFGKTAQYASQGRGLFKLIRLPSILFTGTLVPPTPDGRKFKTSTESTLYINKAEELLKEGVMAKSASTSSHSLASYEEFSYSGPTRKPAHTQIFGPLVVDFFMMGNSKEEASALYYTFMRWQEYIAGPRYRVGEVNREPISDSTLFAVEYYNDYVTEAELQIFSPFLDAAGKEVVVFHNKYFEVWPQSIGGLSPSWEAQDSPITFSVTFEFYYTQSMLNSTQ